MSSSSVKQCASCARSTHDVHHAIVGVNVVIGVLLGDLHVVRVDPIVVCDDVAVRRTLVLIALCRNHCFHRDHFSQNLLCGRCTVHRIRAQRSDEGDPEDPGMNVRGCAHWLLTHATYLINQRNLLAAGLWQLPPSTRGPRLTRAAPQGLISRDLALCRCGGAQECRITRLSRGPRNTS